MQVYLETENVELVKPVVTSPDLFLEWNLSEYMSPPPKEHSYFPI